MNDERLAELREKYKDRNLLEELGWGAYANHSGYQSKSNGEFINWLCNAAYRKIKDQTAIDLAPQWIPVSERLPETHITGDSVSGIFMQSKPVLVYGVPEHEKDYSFHVVTYCDDLNGVTYWSTELDAVTINKVTAWMPLPEPYKEGEG